MKAILVTAGSGSFENLHGHTFEVSEVANDCIILKGVDRDTPGLPVSFAMDNVLIVDLDKEYRSLESIKNDENLSFTARGMANYTFKNLQAYCVRNRIEFTI